MKRLTLVLGMLFMGGLLATSLTSCGNSGDKAASKDEAVEQTTTNDEAAASEATTDETKATDEAATTDDKMEGKCGEGKCGGAEATETDEQEKAESADVEKAEQEAPAAAEANEEPTEKCGK